MTVATQDLTYEEIHAGFDALIKRVAELTAERDCAFEMARHATKDLDRIRRESEARMAVKDVLIGSLRISADTDKEDIRRLTDRVHELALANEDLQQQLEQARQKPEPARLSWWSRHIGNSF